MSQTSAARPPAEGQRPGPPPPQQQAARPMGATTAARKRIDPFLKLMVDRGASDLHLHVGATPYFRVRGEMTPLRFTVIRENDWSSLLQPITPPALWTAFKQGGEADFAYEVPGGARFRVNLFAQLRGSAAVLRVIPTDILTMEQLGLPPQMSRLCQIQRGLVLVIGATGSGKSTTLAAVIDRINRTRPAHIVTLEDPIEFVHQNHLGTVHQREVGTHVRSFADGLRAAAREDPDLLLVGEMRDIETISLALEAAQKGLLVFGTLHANDTAQCIDRIVGVFPDEEQDSVRASLADSLQAAVAQQLLKREGGGRVAAHEILFGSPALASLVREGKTQQIRSYLQTNQRLGTMTMDDSLRRLVEQGHITAEVALERAIDKDALKGLLGGQDEAEATVPIEPPAREQKVVLARISKPATVKPDAAAPGPGRLDPT